jgi:CHASE1-domain containing sensor protein
MTPAKEHEACMSKDSCREHMLWEEKVEKIPHLVSWMNITKGVMILLVLLMTILFTLTSTTRSELTIKQKDFEAEMGRRQEKMDRHVEELSKQVRSISEAVLDINSSVRIMTKTYELTNIQISTEIANLKEKDKRTSR